MSKQKSFKWRTVLGLILLYLAMWFNWQWIWGVLFLVHQALNPDRHKLVLFLLLGVGKILPDDECRDINALCLGITPVFPPFRRKITLSMGFIT